jgi:hypothetical protein
LGLLDALTAMSMLLELVENKAVLSALSLIGGGVLGSLIAALRGRLKTLEYTVTHDRVALAAEDAVFGSVRVTWQGHEVTNLFTSTVTLENATTRDYTQLKFKVYTGDTLLLTQYTEIPGTSFILKWTDEYEAAVHVVPGQQPTDQQFWIFRHNREFIVPVLNRGQKAVVRFLTTVPVGTQGPAVWLDMLHPGVRVEFRPNVPQVHGVPVRFALPIGLLACILVLIASSVFVAQAWVAGPLCMSFGLVAQSVGAFIYRGFRYLKNLVLA